MWNLMSSLLATGEGWIKKEFGSAGAATKLSWSAPGIRFVMASRGRRMSTFTFGCLILCCLASRCAANSWVDLDEVDAAGSSGLLPTGRHLLQNRNPCPYQFAYILNFTNLEASCPNATLENDPTYPKAACCGALAALICPYQSYFNDPNSQCPESFFTTLELVTGGNLTQSFFQLVCTDVNQPNGIPCPSNAPAPAPDSGFRLRSLFPTGFSFVLAGATIKWWFA